MARSEFVACFHQAMLVLTNGRQTHKGSVEPENKAESMGQTQLVEKLKLMQDSV